MDQNRTNFNSRDLAEIRAHLDNIGIELYNGSRSVDLQITHVAGIGVVFGWPSWRSPGHRKIDLERHVKKLSELESASHQPIWIKGKTNLVSTRKLYGIKWVDKGGCNPFKRQELQNNNIDSEKSKSFKDVKPRTTINIVPVLYSRCLVIDEVSEDESIVCFIDYGDCAQINNSELFELEPEYAAIPLICRAFVLYEMPLKLLPLPSKKIKKSLFNKPMYQCLLKWLENKLTNEVVQAVPTRDVQNVLSRGKIRSYRNESGNFGVLLIAYNGININDEFKRETEKVKASLSNDSKYDESSSEESVLDDPVQYMQAEEDFKMLSILSQMQDDHKLKRKSFLWTANQADKLIDFALSVQKLFGSEGNEDSMNLIEYWDKKFTKDIELLKQTSKSIEDIGSCLEIVSSFNKSDTIDIKNQDTTKYFQSAVASLTTAQLEITKSIEESYELSKIETELINKLHDLESLNDQWKECFGFINSGNNTRVNSSDENGSLQSVISFLQAWSKKQKHTLRPLFDETKTFVQEFSQEQSVLQNIRLRRTKRKKTDKESKSIYEYEKIIDSETTISEANESLEIRHHALRKKYHEAISSIKKESDLFEKFNIERIDLERKLQQSINKVLSKVNSSLEGMSTDLLLLLNLLSAS